MSALSSLALVFTLGMNAYATNHQQQIGGFHITASEQQNQPATADPETKAEIKLCFLGDNHLASYTSDANRNEDPYKFVHTQLDACDVVIANLETNIATPGVGTGHFLVYTF